MVEVGRIEKRKQIPIKWSKDAEKLCVHNPHCFINLNREQIDNMLRKYEAIIISMNDSEWDNFMTENDYSNDICLPRITKLIDKYKDKY